MRLSFLPKNILQAILTLNENLIYEIRIRKNQPVILNYNFTYTLLSNLVTINDNFICNENIINEIINQLTAHSIYAFNNNIKEGFITTDYGIRVGICGDIVAENDKIITINNFYSLNIRIPHFINNCSKEVRKYIFNNEIIYNTLICSPPFLGKTTILKDIAFFCDYKFNKPILIIDERGEFVEVNGKNIDKISYSSKEFGFNIALRTMSPYVVITDELSNNDFEFLNLTKKSGVKVIATCHCDNINSLIFENKIKRNLFDRIIFLKNCGHAGVIDTVYDGNFDLI